MFARLRLPILALFAWTLVGTVPAAAAPVVTVDGENFRIDGALTYPGMTVEGLLVNARMVNAAFDDENPATVGRWAYPDTKRWDPERNTNEFLAALPTYAQKGMKAFSLNLQGGNPVPGCSCNATHEWITTAFTREGALKDAWMSRVGRIITAAGQSGMVVILGVMYHGQDQRLADEAAAKRAVDETVDWVLANGHTNVLIEIAAESNHGLTSHAIVKTRVHELIARVQQRSGGKLAASTGFTGGAIPPAATIAQADFVMMHANGKDAAGVRGMVDTVRATSAWKADPKPIVFTEDSTSLGNFDAAVGRKASWGYHDKGNNDYLTGFQTPPINWGLSTSAKRNFFDRVAQLAGPTTVQKSLRFTPATMSIVANPGDPATTRTASLDASDGSSPSYTLADDAAWLSATPGTGSAPASPTITVDPAGLAAGTYTGTVTATGSGYTAGTLRVTLTVGTPSGGTGAYAIMVSSSPSRSSPVALDGRTVSGNIYAFTSPNTNVDVVTFYIDDPQRLRAPFKTEGTAPFDLAGGTSTGASPYDTTKLADGSHTLTASLKFMSGSVEVVNATFMVQNSVTRLTLSPASLSLAAKEGGTSVSSTVTLGASDGGSPNASMTSNAAWLSVAPAASSAPAALTVTANPAGLAPGTYTGKVTATASGYADGAVTVTFTVSSTSTSTWRIVVSASSNRSAPTDLEGKTVSGKIYAFTTPNTGVSQVRFYIDDPNRVRTPFRSEGTAPFDLGGGTATVANPYDTARLANGSHTVTAALTLSAGGSEVVHATFTVAN